MSADDMEAELVEALEEEFADACESVAVLTGAGRLSKEVLLRLYGYYKQANEGECTLPQPGVLQFQQKAKWGAWKALGSMGKEEAMVEYINLAKIQAGGSGGGGEERKIGTMGPVTSTLANAEGQEDVEAETLHEFAGQGDVENVQRLLDGSADVNTKDDDGLTPLHWAADRGSLVLVTLLLNQGAEINAVDNDGQTPLHYGAMCEQEEVCRSLIDSGADTSICDASGETARSAAPSSWSWWIDSS